MKFTEISKGFLNDLYDKWTSGNVLSDEEMVYDLVASMQECVEQTATKRIHSRPWIDSIISDRFKELRKMKKKCRNRRSRRNAEKYKEFLDETMIIVQQEERKYWLSQCNKLTTVSEKDKWKLINKLTNQQVSGAVQPIRV